MTSALSGDEGAVSRRGEFFFWSGLVLIANALAGMAMADVAVRGFGTSTVNLFGISAVTLAACAAALALVREDDAQPNKADYLAVALCLIAALLPNASFARFMVSAFGAYLVFAAAAGSPTRRAGIIMVAIGGALFWGTFMLATLGHPVLELDAKLTSWLYGLERTGNILDFSDGSKGGVIIAAGCSSWHGLSIALLFWVLLYQWFDIPIRRSAWLWLALALAVTIIINSLRLAALASYPAHFEEIHTGYGAVIASWLTMILVAAICLFGERREIFAR